MNGQTKEKMNWSSWPSTVPLPDGSTAPVDKKNHS